MRVLLVSIIIVLHHKESMPGIHSFMQEDGFFGGELIAIDSSKFKASKASNSKKQNFNQAKLKKRIDK